MQLSSFQKALAVIKQHGLDATDVQILAIVEEQAAVGGATIMKLPALLPTASLGTIHTRIKRMVRLGFLTKTVEETNQRRKLIGYGPRTHEFLKALGEV